MVIPVFALTAYKKVTGDYEAQGVKNSFSIDRGKKLKFGFKLGSPYGTFVLLSVIEKGFVLVHYWKPTSV